MTPREREVFVATVQGLRLAGQTLALAHVATGKALERANALLDAAEALLRSADAPPSAS